MPPLTDVRLLETWRDSGGRSPQKLEVEGTEVLMLCPLQYFVNIIINSHTFYIVMAAQKSLT